MNSNRTFTMLKPDSVEQGYMLPILNMIKEAGFKIIALKYKKMTKEEAENFIYKCLVDNESKKDPKDKLSRLDICDILHTDFEIPKSTAYRYYKDSFNLYKWEQAKPDPDKKIKDNKDTILDNVLDTAEAALADGDTISYFKGIELYSKLLTRFKKV